jgi:hypothetical protein
MTQLLENLSVGGSTLMVTMGTDRDVVLASSNIKKIWTLPANQLNAQELLARDTVIMTVEAARWVEETLADEPHGRRGAKWRVSVDSASVLDVTAPEPEESAAVETEPATEPSLGGEQPKPRRRRAAAAKPEPTASATDEGVPEEQVSKPRARRRRPTSATTNEQAAGAPDAPADSPEEET